MEFENPNFGFGCAIKMATVPYLSPSVEELIARICNAQSLSPPDYKARLRLVEVGEAAALRIMTELASQKIRNLSGYIIFKCNNSEFALARNAESIATQESACCSGPPTPRSAVSRDAAAGEATSPVCAMPQVLYRIPPSVPKSGNVVKALGHMEFRKAFLILSYCGGKKLENFISEALLDRIKNFPMVLFECEAWKAIGRECIPEHERRKNVDWDSGKPYVYHCHVYSNGEFTFKGPYIQNTGTHLQRVLGDDNILLVKFAEEKDNNSTRSYERLNPFFQKLAEDGIAVGLRHYKFFVFKDGGKEEKKKSPTSSPVKCYFVRTASCWAMDEDKPYILFNKSISEARTIFMHVHTVSSLNKYMLRFSLILSKTIKFDVDLASVNVQVIDDIPCREFLDEFKRLDRALNTREYNSSIVEPPLLIQFRLFNNGYAVKGTLLINKQLPFRTILFRPSMRKVQTDPDALGIQSNSLEIVGTSNRPKKTCLSRTLIALLHYGGVPKEYFLELVRSAIDDLRNARFNKRSALRVSLRYGEMDEFLVSRMILCGVPLDEPYLLSRLFVLMKEERKGLIQGKLPVDDCYYLMGTADPTGTLKHNEVCIILDNGQVSGDVLVYKHPGLHFGDIHRLTATYIKDLEDVIGNAKHAIFFSVKGTRSLTDEIANSDLDGDMYWVSRNPQLLACFTPGKPWVRPAPAPMISKTKPTEFSETELERELFQQFLINRFMPSYAISEASNHWMVYMDRLLTLVDDCFEEKKQLEEKMIHLVNLYYNALDAPKSGLKVEVPRDLKADLFPHFMGRTNSYISKSILGLIHDQVDTVQTEDVPPNAVWLIPCLSEEAREPYSSIWKKHYDDYRCDMATALQGPQEYKDKRANDVIQKYKKLLYGAAEFEESTKKEEDIFNEALAIYQIAYKMAKSTSKVSYCSFAWKVAGRALCKLHAQKQEKDASFLCLRSVLREVLG
ncbi:probable RNA-dependent RNA polymerase 4 isoform X2 [Dendrobium catenatum]|uniref:probable RNA-dependent RNA polymerase 4 isoform X2 n=1 Tax=Dendrobium catenatum TaxID=906689 RepID=UPI00109FFAB8|nr:probable RNA-dependent RNA polymerase 4 isoform X2 [Dendrobium catenatum]